MFSWDIVHCRWVSERGIAGGKKEGGASACSPDRYSQPFFCSPFHWLFFSYVRLFSLKPGTSKFPISYISCPSGSDRRVGNTFFRSINQSFIEYLAIALSFSSPCPSFFLCSQISSFVLTASRTKVDRREIIYYLPSVFPVSQIHIVTLISLNVLVPVSMASESRIS